jgi:hypothetical protein
LEKDVTSIFRVKEKDKQETRVKQVASRADFLFGSLFSVKTEVTRSSEMSFDFQ